MKSSRLLIALALTAAVTVTAWGQAKEPQYKDRAEYDLFTSIIKEQNPTQKLSLLDQWKQKYPETEFMDYRMQLYLDTYRALNQGAKVLETAKAMVARDPKSGTGLLWINIMTPALGDTSADALNTGEQAAKSMLENLDTIFAAEKKPQGITDDQWSKEKNNVRSVAHTTLGWVNWQRKNLEEAEKQFTEVLKISPTNGQVSYWLGTAIVQQKKPEKQSSALYHFARAATYDGPGALDPNTRKQVLAYLEKAYTNFHGDRSGLDEIIARAKTDPLPPADFKIESSVDIAIRKEEEFKKTNPQLALWMGVKKELAGPNGPAYFESTVKGAALPKFKGTVISQKPAARPKEVVVGIADAATPEVTLVFENPLPSKADPGTEIEFEGIPTGFTADPFMLTMEVEREKLTGWPAAAAPAAKKATGGKKGKKK
ncbi:MAG: hypothetical protein SFV54_12335 [Bryobacteraceae bacterium]|nr:hypothetical protein [Bryobacteraceae bacterium]